MLTLTAITTTFIFPIIAVLTPFYVKNVLHDGPGVLGVLWAGRASARCWARSR